MEGLRNAALLHKLRFGKDFGLSTHSWCAAHNRGVCVRCECYLLTVQSKAFRWQPGHPT